MICLLSRSILSLVRVSRARQCGLVGSFNPFLRSVRGAYLAAGDYNEDFETLVNTNVASGYMDWTGLPYSSRGWAN